METTIKKIEDMSLNAWPSHKMELYDGWILRFSYFYTHRTNSVEQFGTSTLPWREKIPSCEQVYKRLGTPAIFKISPLVSQTLIDLLAVGDFFTPWKGGSSKLFHAVGSVSIKVRKT